MRSYVSYCLANDTLTGGSSVPGSVAPALSAFGCGDQREQEDERFASGLTLRRDIVTGRIQTEFGGGFRDDNIYVLGLYPTEAQIRFPNGTLSDDRVVERDDDVWGSNTYHAGNKLRLAEDCATTTSATT